MPAFAFGPFHLDTTAYRLTRDGTVVDASPRQLDLLAYFASRPAQLVTRDELFQTLWPDVTVTDNALTQLVSELRRTLGDPSMSPRYVQTVARRGYRFVASVARAETHDASSSTPQRSHETSNLDALRAATEGRLKLEALDPAEVEAAIESFDRAIALDPAFAAAYVGRANARFWKYEQTKYGYRPDAALLAAGIHDARHGIVLAPDYAEAHATLAYLLTATGRSDESCTAARAAITLEPQQWRHHFRLGHASWGETRLDALRRCLQLYPSFPFAHFQMAMVYVAREDLDTAAQVISEGVAVLECGCFALQLAREIGERAIDVVTEKTDRPRKPVKAAGRKPSARRASHLSMRRSFLLLPSTAAGCALARAGHAEQADADFRQALAANREQARAHLGLADLAGVAAQATTGQGGEVGDSLATHLDQAHHAITQLQRGGRTVEAALMTAGAASIEGRPEDACAALERMLTEAPVGAAGWSIPIEPLLERLRSAPAFGQVLRHLARRAQ